MLYLFSSFRFTPFRSSDLKFKSDVMNCSTLRSPADLTLPDLTHADLTHTDLTHTDLTHADFTPTDLTHADMAIGPLDP